MKFYDKDPDKEDSKEIPSHKFFENIGLKINPTHNFELLKPFRLEQFEKSKQEFIAEREFNEVKTTDFDIHCCYYAWLKREIKVTEQWLSDTFPNGEKRLLKRSTSEQIEILKYKQYVSNEMEETEKKINISQQSVSIFSKEMTDVLTAIHIKFNGILFNEIPLKDFYDTFKTSTKSKIIVKYGLISYFNYLLSKIEDKRDKIICPHFNKWYFEVFGRTYKTNKLKPKKDIELIRNIENFIKK